MNITISYRPFSGTIAVWDTLNDTMDESELTNIVDRTIDGDDENYFVAIGTLHGAFHYLQVLDCHGQGQHWNLWASAYLPDSIISKVLELVAEWEKARPSQHPLLVTHKATLEM